MSNIVLDPHSTQYQLSSSLLEIVSNSMVEKWTNQTSYENYFNQCRPESCTAKYISRGNIIYIITTVIGLIGGLAKVYKFIVPIMVTGVLRYFIPTIRSRFINRNRVTLFQQNVRSVHWKDISLLLLWLCFSAFYTSRSFLIYILSLALLLKDIHPLFQNHTKLANASIDKEINFMYHFFIQINLLLFAFASEQSS